MRPAPLLPYSTACFAGRFTDAFAGFMTACHDSVVIATRVDRPGGRH